MELALIALSSNGNDRYEVVVSIKAEQVGITCGCPATVLCKHILALIDGKPSSIFPTRFNDEDTISSAIALISSSEIPKKYRDLNLELDELKKSFKLQEKQLKMRINSVCSSK